VTAVRPTVDALESATFCSPARQGRRRVIGRWMFTHHRADLGGPKETVRAGWRPGKEGWKMVVQRARRAGCTERAATSEADEAYPTMTRAGGRSLGLWMASHSALRAKQLVARPARSAPAGPAPGLRLRPRRGQQELLVGAGTRRGARVHLRGRWLTSISGRRFCSRTQSTSCSMFVTRDRGPEPSKPGPGPPRAPPGRSGQGAAGGRKGTAGGARG